MLNRKRYNRFTHILGPGVVTGAADDDPSGIATNTQVGAQFGAGLLWLYPVMLPMLVAVQEVCARIGAVTGKGLAAIIKENYSRKLLYLSVFLVVTASTLNIGADIGALASTLRLFVDVPYVVLIVLFATCIVLLEIFVRYVTYAKILKWFALALLAYPLTALITVRDWPKLFGDMLTLQPIAGTSMVFMIIAMLGTTVSPYLFFWDTSEEVEEEIAKHRLSHAGALPKITRHFIRSIKLDNLTGMIVTILTGLSIAVVGYVVLYQNGVREINTATDAALALQPLVQGFPNAGLLAKIIFSVGIIGLGLLAIPVLAGSSAYAVSEMLGWKEGLYRKFKRAAGFYAVIALSVVAGVLLNLFGINPIKALVYAAVFNGIAAVPLLFMIAKIGNNRVIMGEYKSGLLSNLFVWLTFVVMGVGALALFYLMAIGN
ncbi:MAG: divalent metal cation transporter [Candidatus Chaera renei]|uniref:Divalent metal cation transporter n=1 Tax=Candidatus Chaera renei TaxID=2506947 RepID=A0A4Q0AJ22_9BACT|nr:MAG: divalent metal cation transporter [Candidatus Chaera renei]